MTRVSSTARSDCALIQDQSSTDCAEWTTQSSNKEKLFRTDAQICTSWICQPCLHERKKLSNLSVQLLIPCRLFFFFCFLSWRSRHFFAFFLQALHTPRNASLTNSNFCVTPRLGCSDISPSTVFVVVIRQSDVSVHGGIGVAEEPSLIFGQSV